MWMGTFLFLFVVKNTCALTVRCDRDEGPQGPIKCIQLPQYYNQYQWATCLKNAYIQLKSKHKHICQDRKATYCWYPCMAEVQSKERGSVTEDCSCKATSNPFYIAPRNIGPECYSPSGDFFCDWYPDCLERMYPCEASSNAYALTYAEKFCRLFDERSGKFSADAQKWMDGVRKCLVVALVPLLRPWRNPTCKEIRETAFASHTPCYLNPDKDVPSICDLSYWQHAKIFWTIKGTFVKLDTAWESIKGFFNIEIKCAPSKLAKFVGQKSEGVMKFFKLKFEKFSQRKRRSTDSLSEADDQSRFADKVGSEIASALKWNTDVMDWLAYKDNLDIVIVLADIKALGIVNTSNPSVNFNHTIQEFASAVEKGTIPLQVDGNKVWIKSVASCSDKSCDDAQTLAVSDKPPWNNGATGISPGILGLCGVIAVFVMLMDKLLF